MISPCVYLAGPIRGLSYDNAVGWREKARCSLADVGINAYSPMRAKAYLKGEANAGGDKLADAYEAYPLSTMKAIVTRDRNDCQRSDMVIMYLRGAEQISIGSVLEVAWADAARVPVVLVMEKDRSNVHEHGMIREMCGFHVETIEEAIEVVKAVLLAS